MTSTTHYIIPGRYEKQLPVSTKVHFKSSTNSTNATSVKASAGTVFNMIIHNTATAGVGNDCHLRLYNLNRVPVVGTDVPVAVIQLSSGVSKEVNFTSGITFTNGIAYSMTAGDTLLDATAINADAVQLYMGYM
jgi:hypothetical protein